MKTTEVRELADRDVPGFSEVYEAYHARILAYVSMLLGRDAAEDLTQEVFVKISRSLSTLEDPSKLTSWIYAITANTVRDAARRRSSAQRATVARIRPQIEDEFAEGGLLNLPDGDARTPEETAIRSEMVACYLDYVKQLPRRQHEVYVLSEFEHLSNSEIARRLSVSVGAVKIRLHRARSRLHEELRRNCRCYTNERGELMGEPRRNR